MLLFVVKIPKVLSVFFGHVEEQLDEEAEANFKMCDVINWERDNYNTHIAQDHKKSKVNTI